MGAELRAKPCEHHADLLHKVAGLCNNANQLAKVANTDVYKRQGKYRMVKNLPEKEGRDYADLTKERYEKQAARQRAACSR